MTTLIKCCGMFRPEDIAAVNAARPDFCGFVIDFPKSHRSVSVELASRLRAELREGVTAVGVFVDRPAQNVAHAVAECALDAVQLHGHEDDLYIGDLRRLTSTPIIQAFKVQSTRDLEAARASIADFVLLDNGQGTGAAFNWQLLEGFDRPYFLAGGLTPQNIAGAIEEFHPYAVDVSSGIESDRLKDPKKINEAVRETRRIK